MRKHRWSRTLIAIELFVGVLLGSMSLPAVARAAGNSPAILGFGGREWHVIGYNGVGVASSGDTMTLLANESFGTTKFKVDLYNPNNYYAGSLLQASMNAAYDGLTDAREKGMVMPRDLSGGSANYNQTGYNPDRIAGPSVSGAGFWPLSVAEVNGVNENVRRFSNDWWLRSPGHDSLCAAFVDIYETAIVVTVGGIHVEYSTLAIRPAFKLNTSSVIFASAASTKSSAIAGGGLVGVPASTSTVKLTALDANAGNLALTSGDVSPRTVKTGDTVSIAYSGAITGADKYVSCVIANGGGITHYGKLSQAASGTASFTVPALENGDYTVKLFNEQCNADQRTDFCSTPIEISMTVDNPIISYDANGGTGTMIPGTATHGVVVTLPANGFAAPIGKQFKEWAIGDVSGIKVAAGGTHIFTADTTVYAIWEDQTYAIGYDANGGTGTMTPGTATHGVAFTLPANGFTVPTGKRFKEWAIGDTSGIKVAAGGTYAFTADTTVYAIWEDQTYAISYDANGGAGTMTPGTATHGVAFTLPANGFTAPTGKRFKEWAIGDTSDIKVAAGGTHAFTADTTVYAIWENIPLPPSPPDQPIPTPTPTPIPTPTPPSVEDVIGARLGIRKVIVPIYGTHRPTIELSLILNKGEGGAVLESARFLDAETAACFSLEVVDYHTLAIGCNPDAPIDVSAYKSAIGLTLSDGRTVTTDKLTLTVARRLTLAASGRLDPLRPASALILKPSIAGLDDRRLTVTAVDGKRRDKGDQTAQFAVTETDHGAYELRRAEGGAINPDYTYTATLTARGGDKTLTAKHAFKVKPGKARATLSAKSVTLSAGNPTSLGEIGISFEDTSLAPVDKLTLQSKAFAVVKLDEGRWAVGFKDGVAVKKGATLRLKVYLKGYEKAATTLKLKVRVER